MISDHHRRTTTALLNDLREGKTQAFDRLMPLVYDELRELAHHKLRFERAGHTLNTTALVHEAYLRLAGQQWAQVNDRTHFFAIAAQAMRRILVSYARQRQAQKRGGKQRPLSLDNGIGDHLMTHPDGTSEELLALDAALNRLEAFNERGCRVVEYRFFGGMTHEEIANVMELSTITVRRAWSLARMWLQKEMRSAP